MDEIIERSVEFTTDIITIIEENINNPNLETLLEEYHLYDIAQVLTNFPDDIIKAFFHTVSIEFAAEIIEYLDEEEATYII